MKRRDLIVMAAGVAGFGPAASLAQQRPVPVIGALVGGSPNPEFALRVFRQGLNELGYEEGRNIRVEVRSAEGKPERLPELAAELARQRVDIIAAWLTPVVLAAKGATSEIPIVMIGAADPVGSGIVASLSRPGRQHHWHRGLDRRSGGKTSRIPQGDVA